jgi:hypothetical protein
LCMGAVIWGGEGGGGGETRESKRERDRGGETEGRKRRGARIYQKFTHGQGPVMPVAGCVAAATRRASACFWLRRPLLTPNFICQTHPLTCLGGQTKCAGEHRRIWTMKMGASKLTSWTRPI